MCKLWRIQQGNGINHLVMESNNNRSSGLEFNEWQWCEIEQMKIFIDNMLLATPMNSSMSSIQNIHDHMKKIC